MPPSDPRCWASSLVPHPSSLTPHPSLSDFDPGQGTVIRTPPGQGRGYWAGAPGVTYDAASGEFHLVYRLRRPRGVEPDRGAEIRVAASTDGVKFNDVWKATKDLLNTTSIERCALVRRPEFGWRMYVSFVDPADGRWMIGLVEAERPEQFDLKSLRPVLKAADVGTEGVKDPFVFQVAGLYHMVISCAVPAAAATADQMHGTHDAYNTGLIESASALATSSDGLAWQWEGLILDPVETRWDSYAARIGTLWHQPPAWLAFYDGSADVSENYEERCGLAYSFDLRTFHRVSRDGPLWNTPHGSGALRYFDVLQLPDATYLYYEMALPDGSHDLRVWRAGSC